LSKKLRPSERLEAYMSNVSYSWQARYLDLSTLPSPTTQMRRALQT